MKIYKFRAGAREAGADFPRFFRDPSAGRFPQALRAMQPEDTQRRFSALLPQIFRDPSADFPRSFREASARPLLIMGAISTGGHTGKKYFRSLPFWAGNHAPERSKAMPGRQITESVARLKSSWETELNAVLCLASPQNEN